MISRFRSTILIVVTKLTVFLQAGTQPKFADDVSIDELAKQTESYTGADLAGLVRQAALQALKNSIIDNGDNDNSGEVLKVHKDHFTQALKNLRPSVSPEVRYLHKNST